MADDTKRWLRPHREAAGFAVQKTFAAELGRSLNKSISDREVRGWENCDKNYRLNVPYVAIAKVLNQKLPEGKQVTAEQLRQNHETDIRQCEINEQRAAAEIDESLIQVAIEHCAPELKSSLLRGWQAEGSVERAAYNIAERIRFGNASEVLVPFSRPFDEAYLEGAASRQSLDQIWAVVEAVSRACVIPGTGYKPGRRQQVGTDQAWLIRIRLLVAQNLPINGLSSDRDRHLKDESTHALITKGVSPAGDPLQRLMQLVTQLVERYDPGREPPPDPYTDRTAFERYCGRLNANLTLDNVTKALFFHLMARPESNEVTGLLYQYLPGLMSFISHEIEGPTEGLLIDDEDMLGGWIARWMYRTGRMFIDAVPPKGSPPSTSAKEKTDMTTPPSNHQTINVFTTGDNSPVYVPTAQDKAYAATHQHGIAPAQILPLLEQLLKATAQEPSPPTELRREIRTLQTEIEEAKKAPSNLPARLKAAIPPGLALGEQATTIMNNIAQMWQSAFGA